ncbi:MAG: Ig-like domain-containing protein [Lachnospiraceae bacterium]|nr:Ig-like domain-containing protein [Lachnospiraceae bacterium]
MSRMQKLKKYLVYVCAAVLLVGNMSIINPTQVKAAAKKVTSIDLNYYTYVLKKKQSVKLKATCLPKTAKNKKVKWKSSNKSVAAVSSSGKVTAKKTGTAKITVTAKDGSGKKAVCTIKVVKKITKIKSLKILAENKEMKPGTTQTLKTKIKPAKATLKSLKWESSDTEIATVTKKGVVKAIKPGTVTITAKAQDGSKKKAVYTIEIKSVENTENNNGGNDPDGSDPGGDNSGGDNSGGDNPGGDNPGGDNPGGDNPGEDNPGEEIIEKVIITQIKLPEDTIIMREGKTVWLSPEITPINATNTTMLWTSSDDTVVSVDKDGWITALKVGMATITATTTDGSALIASCEINVLPGRESAMDHTKAYYVYELDRNAAKYQSLYTEEGKESESYIEPSKISGAVFKWSFYLDMQGGITTNQKFYNFLNKLCEDDTLGLFGMDGLSVKEHTEDYSTITMQAISGDTKKEIALENVSVIEAGKDVIDPNGLSTKASRISFTASEQELIMEIYDNGSRIAIYRPNYSSPHMEFYQDNTNLKYIIRMTKFFNGVLMDEIATFPDLNYMEMYNIY